jgi:hypothetical protein
MIKNKKQFNIHNAVQHNIAEILILRGYITYTKIKKIYPVSIYREAIRELREEGFNISGNNKPLRTLYETCDQGYYQVDYETKQKLKNSCKSNQKSPQPNNNFIKSS